MNEPFGNALGISGRRQSGNCDKQGNAHNKWDIVYPMSVPLCASVQPDNRSAGCYWPSEPSGVCLRYHREATKGLATTKTKGMFVKQFLAEHRVPHGSAISNEPHHVAGTRYIVAD